MYFSRVLPILAAGACLLAATAAQATVTPPVFNAPGIPAAGFPDFMGSISGTATQKGSVIFVNVTGTSSSPAVFNLNSTHQYAVQNEKYTLTAQFGTNGQFQSGNVSITGAISGLGVAQQNLYSANLIAAAQGNNFSVGFETTNVGESGWASKYQNGDESVYLYNLNAHNWFGTYAANTQGKINVNFTGQEFTTVPLPAAAWLLVAGIGGLSGFARRRIIAV